MTFEDAVWIGLGLKIDEENRIMIDPMTSRDQWETEQAERQDEQVREMDYRHAEDAAEREIARFFTPQYPDQGVGMTIYAALGADNGTRVFSDDALILRSFVADYGIPALLRVMATAAERQS